MKKRRVDIERRNKVVIIIKVNGYTFYKHFYRRGDRNMEDDQNSDLFNIEATMLWHPEAYEKCYIKW